MFLQSVRHLNSLHGLALNLLEKYLELGIGNIKLHYKLLVSFSFQHHLIEKMKQKSEAGTRGTALGAKP